MNRILTIVFLTGFLLCLGPYSPAQTTRRVLFLGNSYTAVNNLPQLVHDVAASAGDSLIFDHYTPGGYTLQDHLFDAVSTNKIMIGSWDYVVLQGQSREPILQTPAFFSGGMNLTSLINQHNPCGVPLLYMTWGRQNGDPTNCAGFPEMCTYSSMDSALRYKYLQLAVSLNAEVSPVSAVWRNLRQNHPNLNLYQADGSHPNAAGSYAAACCFYAAIFKKDPTLISFDYSLSATDAALIRSAAKTEVYDSLSIWDYKKLPRSDFRYSVTSGNNQVILTPLNNGVIQDYAWNFGDGNSSTIPGPIHSYASDGAYLVSLTTTTCDLQGMYSSTSDTIIEFCSHTPSISTTKPWLCAHDSLWTQAADAYQWYAAGLPIPETRRFLPDYRRYGTSEFTVRSTLNGCSELSQTYHANPFWPGYYFDAAFGGNPCEGDTALIVLLHVNGSLSGTEVIRWYRNDTLLPLANNQDSLEPYLPGIYRCEVVNPNSNCPWDTTYFEIDLSCSGVGLPEKPSEAHWMVFPNPASDFILLKHSGNTSPQEIRIYNLTGALVKKLEAPFSTRIEISGWPAGMYLIQFEDSPQKVQRFVKE